MEKLKKRWGVDSNFQAVIILIVFAITGSTSAIIAKPILSFIGIEKAMMHPALYFICYFNYACVQGHVNYNWYYFRAENIFCQFCAKNVNAYEAWFYNARAKTTKGTSC